MIKKLLILICAAMITHAAQIEELIQGASIDGIALMRYLSNSGRNDGGQGILAKVIADATSGEFDGFTFNIGLFYHYGATPQQGSTSNGAVNGSRGDRLTGDGGNAFGLSTLWGKYNFESIQTNIVGGKMRMDTPITNKINDRAVGAGLESKNIDGLSIKLSYFDSWATDSEYIGGFGTFIKDSDTSYGGYNFGNNIATIGFDGSYGSHSFRAWYFYIDKMANSLFGEFKAGNVYEISAQVAFTELASNPSFKVSNTSTSSTTLSASLEDRAKTRGLYSLQFAYKPMDEFRAKVGFVGSFGRGYGVALTNEATFNKGGKWWFDNYGSGVNGFSLFGQGGKDDTHINIWYVVLDSRISIVDLGLDIVGISGKNNYAVSANKTNGSKTNVGIDGGNRTFYEVTPSFAIHATQKFKISAYYAMAFGQINAQRFWSEFLYTF